MIQVKTTQNMYGISIRGDYDDIHGLHSALSRYLDVYYESHKDTLSYDEYEFLLSLNYDLRSAWMGDGLFDVVNNHFQETTKLMSKSHHEGDDEKEEYIDLWEDEEEDVDEIDPTLSTRSIDEILNAKYRPEETSERWYDMMYALNRSKEALSIGNFYLKVECLYPIFFHYMVAYRAILEEEPQEVWFEKRKPEKSSYTFLQAQRDYALIRFFFSSAWIEVHSFLGDAMKDIEDIMTCYRLTSVCENIYTEALMHAQLAWFPELNEKEKKAFLLSAFHETAEIWRMYYLIRGTDITEEQREQLKRSRKAHETRSLTLRKRNPEFIFMNEADFDVTLDLEFHRKNISREKFEDLCYDLFGEIPDEDPVM